MADINPPNYTQIPNIVFDLMPEMEESELRVVLAICRMTFGWHKDRDTLSLTQLEKLTGLSRPSVKTGIDAAMGRGLVDRRPAGQSFSYCLLVKPVYQLNDFTSKEALLELVKPVDRQLVKPVYTQKKEINKGNKSVDVEARLGAMTFSDNQIAAIAAAAKSRGGFSLEDCDICDQWLAAQRDGWDGKYGSLYNTLKAGKLPVLPRTNGHKAPPQPVLTMDDVKRQSAAIRAANPEIDAMLAELKAEEAKYGNA